MLDILVGHMIGTGLQPVPTTGADKLDQRIQRLWDEWREVADVEGRLNFNAMQALAVRGMIESGEVVVRFIDRKIDDPALNGCEIPLQLQLLESDFIDHAMDGFYGGIGEGMSAGTQRVRLGVGLGEYDRWTGLWLWPYHPGDNFLPVTGVKTISTWVDRNELVHLFRPQRPGQIRGVSWYAPIMTTARELADFIDATVVKSRIEACFAAFVTSPTEFDSPAVDNSSYYGTAYADPAMPDVGITAMEPGMIKDLRPGQDIKFAQPSATTQAEPIIMQELMAMAAGMGCTYDQLSGDLRGANYSSLRAGKLDFRRLIEQIQFMLIIPNLCTPIWNRFISRAILAGVLSDRAGGYPVDWITPAWEPVNPKFDLDAEQHAVRSLRISPQEYTAAWGNDWRKVQDDTAEYYKRLDSLGLVSDLDPRKTSRAGQAQKMPGTGGPGEAPGGGEDQQSQPSGNGQAYDADGNPLSADDLQEMVDQQDEADVTE